MSELQTVRALAPTDCEWGDGTPVLEPGEYVKADVARGLYAACEAALAYIDERDTDDWPPALDAMLRAALAAAMGESHA